MATDTFIEMVSDMITETGLNGGNVPSSIAAATGDAAKVVYWIRVADLQIQRERIDWKFLWDIENTDLTPASNVVPAPVDQPDAEDVNSRTVLINVIAKDRLAIIDPNGQAHFPVYMDWNEFAPLYNYEAQPANDYPSFWTVRPDRTILLSEPIASSGMACRYEYWRKPLRLRDNNDVSRIPDDFSRIIVVRAKVMYAEHEDAPEVDIGATAEYDLLLTQMISVETPESEWQRLENSDQLLVVGTRE
jgi:hypothetical protein